MVSGEMVGTKEGGSGVAAPSKNDKGGASDAKAKLGELQDGSSRSLVLLQLAVRLQLGVVCDVEIGESGP